MKCINCRTEFEEGVSFECPECHKEICRCSKCKKLAMKYKCKCGFVGP